MRLEIIQRTLHKNFYSMAPKKPKKQITKEKPDTEIVGPISLDKSGNIIIKINAKPGAKNNNITGMSLKTFVS